MIPEADVLDQWTVVSDCIAKPDEASQAIEILTPDMFTEAGCRTVFQAFMTLHANGLPTDINHVIEQLEHAGKLTQDLGVRLHQAGCDVRAPQPVSYYAQRVLKHYRKRCAREILLKHHQSIVNGSDLPEMLTELQGDLSRLEVNRAAGRAQRRPDINSRVKPFPVHALPTAMQGFIRAAALSIGCDPSFVALPMLAAAASAIGTTRRLMVKRGWSVPSLLWTVLIGESGSQKSPPMRAVMKPFQARQKMKLSHFACEFAEYKRETRASRKAARKDVEEPVRELIPPLCERCLVSDTTLEGLVPILQQNPRGVLLARDELVGWIGSFDKYSSKGSASADVAHWLSIYNVESLIVDRKTGEKTTLFVPDASVSVCGSIQPGILNRVLTSEHRENGLAARLLMTYPPRTAKQWRDDEIPSRLEEQWANVVEELFAFQHDLGADGTPKPALIRLSDEARLSFAEFVDQTGEEQFSLAGDLSAAWSKLEEIPARLALVIHCVRQASGEPIDPWVCDTDSIAAGIELATWFKDETQRIYRLLRESQEDRNLRQVAHWIKVHGGCVRIRDLVSGRRDIETAEQAESLLHQLVDAGYGYWQRKPPGKKGGRASMVFILYPELTDDEIDDVSSAEPD